MKSDTAITVMNADTMRRFFSYLAKITNDFAGMSRLILG